MAMYDRLVDRIVGAADIYSTRLRPLRFETLVRRAACGRRTRVIRGHGGLLDNYLLPLDLHSLLDVCFSINGVPFGSFSCETGGAR